ncbi:hypothetical protein BO71DRAFT_453286 [Aspergillus ellipticus CBS 707.79]|uniref:Enoyl reductase (ER) domain-containing protein n=1 Tax=Aspergillus ellipticus CBS 707.79 TaxID=1448320 RepID=A0A319CWI4_9EURO|nr:hypothetical protein BO71DRAFT_453286 [Aspergillus ellipticus CBS 707.79]
MTMTDTSLLPALPPTCKAGVVNEFGPEFEVLVQDVAIPLHATGLCYSDIHYMSEDFPLPRMKDHGVRSPGHEGAGVVVGVGSEVTDWKAGDRAGIAPTWDTCMSCELCSSNMECHCACAVPTGLKVPGTYQQYLLSPARYTSRIPEGVDDLTAGPIMCSGSTMYRSLVESGLRDGQWAVFIGAAGGVGHMGVQIAKAMGLRVIGIDGGEGKRDLCLQLGCGEFVDFRHSSDIAGEVIGLTDGKGAHGVFVTASSPSGYSIAPRMARIGGKVMCIGLPSLGTAIAGDDPTFLVLRNLKIIGTLTRSRQDTAEALALAARGLLKPIYETFSIDELSIALDKLRQGKVNGRCVVDFTP